MIIVWVDLESGCHGNVEVAVWSLAGETEEKYKKI
jgi:hypothetical protein